MSLIVNFFVILFFLSLLCILFGLIRPSLFGIIFRSHAKRLIVGLSFAGLSMILIFIVGIAVIIRDYKSNSQKPKVEASKSQPTPHVNDSWAGYTKMDSSNSITSVSSEWVVPSVEPYQTIRASSAWVGIGGNGPEHKGLIQTGTDQIGGPHNGVPSTIYGAFWECFPDPANHIDGFQVAPGNKVEASINKAGLNWAITLKNITNGQIFTKTAACNADQTTAEWILEDVDAKKGILGTMPTFSNITFSNLKVNGKAPTPDHLFQLFIVQNNIAVTNVYPLDSKGTSFTISDARK